MKKWNQDYISERVGKGAFVPHQYLSNLCLTHVQNGKGFVCGKMFPTVPVGLSSSYFYEFNKGDLLRDNMAAKPEFGHVSPAQWSVDEKQYRCQVDQVISGVSQIAALDYQRAVGNHFDPRKLKVKFIGEQMLLHQDILWSKKFFRKGVWGTEYHGVEATPTEGEFYQFDCELGDPVEFMTRISSEMVLSGLRRPNKMCIGAKVYAALKTNPSILERVKYQGSAEKPANVTLNILAQLFGLEEIVVSEGVYNAATIGMPDDLRFICSEKDALLVYSAEAPSLEEPSAGYTFAWDMLGNGNYTPILHYEGAGGTHTEFVEGLLATDHQITCKELGVYLVDVVK